MDEKSLNESIISELKKTAGSEGMVLPPECFLSLEGRFVSYMRHALLETAWPMKPWYAGPTGMLQGGFLTAMFDNTFGPFSYLIAKKACTSLDLETHFMRAVPVDEVREIKITARLVARSPRIIFMRGEAKSDRGKAVAISATKLMVL